MEEQIDSLKNLLLSEDPTNIDLAIEIMKGFGIDFISFVDEHIEIRTLRLFMRYLTEKQIERIKQKRLTLNLLKQNFENLKNSSIFVNTTNAVQGHK